MRASSVLQALKTVTMSIFQSDPTGAAFAQARIHRHYAIKNLEARGVEIAEVAQVALCFTLFPSTLKLWNSPTEWHGEGGKSGNNKTGHLTVRFKTKDGAHITTHHVYQDDSHY